MNNMSSPLTILKIGGNLVNNTDLLNESLIHFQKISGYKILVHGGGNISEEIALKLGIKTQKHEGRRITDKPTLDLVTMVYAGLVNKNVVSLLQSMGMNCIGLSGADGNSIQGVKRPVKDIDYGFVGDIDSDGINDTFISNLLKTDITPVFCPVTHDRSGQLLNTNADTIAATVAQKMSETYSVNLIYCFEKKGVLSDPDNENSFIPDLKEEDYRTLKKQGSISEGMIPKLDNCYDSIRNGVNNIFICRPESILSQEVGTKISL